MESLAEYVDLQFSDPFLATHERALRSALPAGFRLWEVKPIFGKTAALTAEINLAEYEVDVGLPDIEMDRAIEELLSADELATERQSKGAAKVVNIRTGIRSISRLPSPASADSARLGMTLQIGEGTSARPAEVLQHLLPWPMEDILALEVTRTGLYIERNGSLLGPMQVI
jgi:radical SAM-linked protein